MVQFLCVGITGNPAAAAHPAFRPDGRWRMDNPQRQASKDDFSRLDADYPAYAPYKIASVIWLVQPHLVLSV
jgi:hypothetical protein